MYAQQTELLYDQARLAVLAAFAAGITLVLVFLPHTPVHILSAWFIAFLLVSGVRYAQIHWYFRRTDRQRYARRWHIAYAATTALSALVWGLTGFVLIPDGVDPNLALLYTCMAVLYVCALSSAALATYSIKLSVYLCFVLPSLLPMGVGFLFSANDIHHTIGLLILMFMLFLILIAFRLNRSLVDSLRKSIEHDELLAQLKHERQHVEILNEDLRDDLANRLRIEKDLRQEKNKAQALAERMQALSSQDGLTGISNRRHLDEFLSREWQRSVRNHEPLALILADIDCFKAYNDIYGHLAGDLCLKQIALLLRSHCRRAGDLAARYGGEEFAIVLGNTDITTSLHLAEEIRHGVEALKIPHCASETGPYISVSFGVASLLPDDSDRLTDLIQQADTALYNAKAGGRNCVRKIDNESDSLNSFFQRVEVVSMTTPHEDIPLFVDRLTRQFKTQGFRCHLQNHDPGLMLDVHTHIRDQIWTVINGRMELITGRMTYYLSAGDCIRLPGGQSCSARALDNTALQLLIAIRQN